MLNIKKRGEELLMDCEFPKKKKKIKRLSSELLQNALKKQKNSCVGQNNLLLTFFSFLYKKEISLFVFLVNFGKLLLKVHLRRKISRMDGESKSFFFFLSKFIHCPVSVPLAVFIFLVFFFFFGIFLVLNQLILWFYDTF